jgi:hypothetical protein
MDKKDINKIKTKINKVKKIYEEYNKNQIKNGGSFNICSILRKHNDEVNLHSKFIYELINPKGSHQQGDKFLKLFITDALDIGKDEDDEKFIFKNVIVKREVHLFILIRCINFHLNTNYIIY